MRRAFTTTIAIEAPASRVLSYIARPENLPEWRRAMLDLQERGEPAADRSRAAARGAAPGEPFWVEVDGNRGTVDYFWSTGGGVDVASARVLAVDGGAQVVVTVFEPPEGCAGCGSLEERAAAVESELALVKALLESAPARRPSSWH